MDCASKYLLVFKAMLCIAVSHAHADIVRTAYNLPRIKDSSDSKAYLVYSDETVRQHTFRYRHQLYLQITSYDFVNAVPLVRHVDRLSCSEYDKMVILMTVVGLDIKEIADVLLSQSRSISTIRNRHKSKINTLMCSE